MSRTLRLSEAPFEKVAVACEGCGLRRRYARAAVLARLGDHLLPDLLNEIAVREGCSRVAVRWGDQCRLVYLLESRIDDASKRI